MKDPVFQAFWGTIVRGADQMLKNRLFVGLWTIGALVLTGCSGISDCKEDAAQCAEMLNANAEK